MTTPKQLYDKLPNTEYASQWGYYQKNQLKYDNGHWGGNVWTKSLPCKKDYNTSSNSYAYHSDSHFLQCNKKPFEKSSYYKDHKKAIDALNKGDGGNLLLKRCKEEAGKSKTSGDLFKGSDTCMIEMNKLCKKGISGQPCEYLKNNNPSIYKNAMTYYCFGNNRDKNINKSTCVSYYKDNYNTNIENNLKNFCASVHNGKPRYQNRDYLTICACHKPAYYYQNIKDSIRKKWGGPPGLDTNPKCIYDDCLASRLYDKKDKCRKIDFTQCIQNVDFDVHGNLTNEGTIKIGQEATCGKDYSLKEEKPTPSKSSSSPSKSSSIPPRSSSIPPRSSSIPPKSSPEAAKKLEETMGKYGLTKPEPSLFDKLKTADSKTKFLILLLLIFVVVIIGFIIQYVMSSNDNSSDVDNDNL